MHSWPALDYQSSKDALATLHMWMQILGKLRLSKSPWLNHSWHATFYVTPHGLTSGLIPDGDHSISVDVNLLNHSVTIEKSDGNQRFLPLQSESVASFYKRFAKALEELKIEAKFSLRPNEVANPVAFPLDEAHCIYDPAYAATLSQVLVRVDQVMEEFRSHYIGKCSPVHLFWGSFDLAVTRFSGRLAPEHPGGIPNLPDRVVRDAYSHEVSSCGFWPGNEMVPYPAFYSYAYPEPAGFAKAQVMPKAAFYHEQLREFILPYEAVRKAKHPELDILQFFTSTYEAAADLGSWNRETLDEDRYLRAARASAKVAFAPGGSPDL
jgi:hypothetical protein